jgi:hypothetical protein
MPTYEELKRNRARLIALGATVLVAATVVDAASFDPEPGASVASWGTLTMLALLGAIAVLSGLPRGVRSSLADLLRALRTPAERPRLV